jgi:hypothetical protein
MIRYENLFEKQFELTEEEIADLKEKFLRSEFRIGFELEFCYIDSDGYRKFRSEVQRLFPEGAIATGDPSVRPLDTDDIPGVGCGEISVGGKEGIQLTPLRIQQIIKLLANMKSKYGVYTNETCGFHHHISWPDRSEKDMWWILTVLAYDHDTQKLLRKFGKYKFIDKKYADGKFIHNIAYHLNRDNLNDYLVLYNTEKFRQFHIHGEYGTMEWRGPRGFLDKQIQKEIKDFYMILYKFIDFINTALFDVKEIINIKGKVFTKQEIYEALSLRSLGIDTQLAARKKAVNIAKFGHGKDRWNMEEMTGEKIKQILEIAPWLKKCKIKNAWCDIGEQSRKLVWKNGKFLEGEFKEGYFVGGEFIGGIFKGRNFKAGIFKGGEFRGEIASGGKFKKGIIYSGQFKADRPRYFIEMSGSTWVISKGGPKWIDGNWEFALDQNENMLNVPPNPYAKTPEENQELQAIV